MQLNYPNLITYMRFITAALLLLDYVYGYHVLLYIWAFSCVSDFLDGFVARYFKQETLLGALLDPIADKVTMMVAFMIILHAYPTAYLCVACCCIILRDIYVSLVRLYNYVVHYNLGSMEVTLLAKVKTAMLMLSVTLFLYSIEMYNPIVYAIGFVLLYSSALVSIYTLIVYISSSKDPVHI